MKRYCILTLPRSGSQLCQNILEDNNPNSFRLSEMFEGWHNFDYFLENNKINKVLQNSSKEVSILSDKVSDDWEYKLNLISQSDDTADYTLRFFPFCHRSFNLQKQILSGLHQNKFVFVSLQRNFEDTVLSNFITKSYLNKGRNIYQIGTQIPKEPIIIPFSEHFCYYQVSTLFASYLSWNQRINDLLGKTNVFHVKYDTIYEDCAKILGHDVSRIVGKTLETNGYDYIVNKDEVRNFIKPYVELLQKQNGQQTP